MHSWATGTDEIRPRNHAGVGLGKQKITDTGPLTKKRMEDTLRRRLHHAAAKAFMKKVQRRGQALFRLAQHHPRHASQDLATPSLRSLGQAGRWQSPYHDTMIDHDKNIGQMLDYLDELGIADNTFVVCSTDNGPLTAELLARRRHDAVPQRKEHQLGRRIPYSDAGALAGQDRPRPDLERDRPAPRLVPDVPRNGRRSGRHGEAEDRPSSDRPHL